MVMKTVHLDPRVLNMAQDEIIKEARAIREAYGERFDFDIEAIFRDAKEREGKSNRKSYCLSPGV